jgi:hypothetical protein
MSWCVCARERAHWGGGWWGLLPGVACAPRPPITPSHRNVNHHAAHNPHRYRSTAQPLAHTTVCNGDDAGAAGAPAPQPGAGAGRPAEQGRRLRHRARTRGHRPGRAGARVSARGRRWRATARRGAHARARHVSPRPVRDGAPARTREWAAAAARRQLRVPCVCRHARSLLSCCARCLRQQQVVAPRTHMHARLPPPPPPPPPPPTHTHTHNHTHTHTHTHTHAHTPCRASCTATSSQRTGWSRAAACGSRMAASQHMLALPAAVPALPTPSLSSTWCWTTASTCC